jgi:GAF domain-containing protein
VDRAILFENRVSTREKLAGTFVSDLRYAWAKPGVTSPLALPVLRAFPFRDFAPTWADALEADRVVACPTREAPALMRELQERQGVQSTLLCPIVPARAWWGFVGFEDCHQARVWRTEEVSLLRTLARAIAASVRHAQMRSSLNQVRTTLRGSVLHTASGEG